MRRELQTIHLQGRAGRACWRGAYGIFAGDSDGWLGAEEEIGSATANRRQQHDDKQHDERCLLAAARRLRLTVLPIRVAIALLAARIGGWRGGILLLLPGLAARLIHGRGSAAKRLASAVGRRGIVVSICQRFGRVNCPILIGSVGIAASGRRALIAGGHPSAGSALLRVGKGTLCASRATPAGRHTPIAGRGLLSAA